MLHLPISDDMHQAIGKISAYWNHVESALENILADLLGVDQYRGRIIFFSINSHRGRRDLVYRLGETYLDKNKIVEFRRLIKRVSRFASKRNDAVHCIFVATQSNDENKMVKTAFPSEAGGAMTPKFTRITVKQARRIAVDMARLAEDLKQFHLSLVLSGGIESSPRIHRESRNEKK